MKKYNLKKEEWHYTSAPLVSDNTDETDDALRAVQRAKTLSDEKGPVFRTVRAKMSPDRPQTMDILVTRA